MFSNYPKDWQCPNELRQKWPCVEADLMPLIHAKAAKVQRWVPGSFFDVDDAIQEGRIALLEAYLRFDDNRGELIRFASVVLNNKYKTMLWKYLTYRRTPRCYVRDGDKWIEEIASNSEYIDIVCDEKTRTDLYTEFRELEEQVYVFNLRLLETLRGLNRKVFECLVNPSIEFLSHIEACDGDLEKPTCKQIAQFLDVKLNAVLWSVSYIRTKFTGLAKSEEFFELFGDLCTKGAPVIHISDNNLSGYDSNFVGRIIKKRNLDWELSTTEVCQSSNGSCIRVIETYPAWGAVLFLAYGSECRTVVIEGKFSPLKGIVLGKNGMREKLPISWYKNVLEEIK